MRKTRLLLLLLLLPFSGRACFNEFLHDSTGQAHAYNDFDLLVYKRNFNFSDLDAKIAKKEKKGMKTFQDSSDYAVLLAKRGFVYRSLDILRGLAKMHGDDYTIAANLGTVYELSGNNDSALYWIRKGIQINPASHQGSEWVHVKILEAKLALQKDPDWLSTHKLLGLEGQAELPDVTTMKKPFIFFTAKEKQVMYQLHERLPFMSPPDTLMAVLFSELAYYQENAGLEAAINHYRYALEYAGGNNATLKIKIRLLEKRLRSLPLKPDHEGMGENIPPLGKENFDPASAYRVLDSAHVYASPVDTVKKADSATAVQPKAGEAGESSSSGASMLFWLLPVLMAAFVGVWMWMRARKKE